MRKFEKGNFFYGGICVFVVGTPLFGSSRCEREAMRFVGKMDDRTELVSPLPFYQICGTETTAANLHLRRFWAIIKRYHRGRNSKLRGLSIYNNAMCFIIIIGGP